MRKRLITGEILEGRKRQWKRDKKRERHSLGKIN